MPALWVLPGTLLVHPIPVWFLGQYPGRQGHLTLVPASLVTYTVPSTGLPRGRTQKGVGAS